MLLVLLVFGFGGAGTLTAQETRQGPSFPAVLPLNANSQPASLFLSPVQSSRTSAIRPIRSLEQKPNFFAQTFNPFYVPPPLKVDTARKLLWASRAANWSALGYDIWTTKEFLRLPDVNKGFSFTYNNTYYSVGPLPGISEGGRCGAFGRRNFGAIVACGAAVYVGWQIGSEKLYNHLDRRGSGKLYKLRWAVIGANFLFTGEHIRMGVENQRAVAKQFAMYRHLFPGIPPDDLDKILSGVK